jgi:NitT/TauT family transport system substrate-binding protein
MQLFTQRAACAARSLFASRFVGSRRRVRRAVAAPVLALALALALALPVSPAAARTLRMGILPVLDTLPLQVAARDGLFAAHGLDVELVPFASAMERDTAMQSGRLDGYFGDMIATFLLIQAGVPMRMVAVSYRSEPGQPMFGLLRAPAGQGGAAADVPDRPLRTGISKNSIMEYLLGRMAAAGPAAELRFEPTEVRKIPIRLQMLLTGQLDVALLPEPLASLARARGARPVTTDEKLGMVLTVLCLHESVRDDVAAFVAAYDDAVRRIAADPDGQRELMVAACRVPPDLAADFPVYRYPLSAVPGEADVAPVQDWMLARGLLRKPLPYGALVAR